MSHQVRKRYQPMPDAGTRTCDHPECVQSGEYRAPRSRSDLNTYYWFCLEHVRAYNASWDFYAGMNAREIEAAVRADVTWQRPTWPLGQLGSGNWRAYLRDPLGIFGEFAEDRQETRKRPETPEDQAMRVMGMEPPLTIPGVKARYKQLVKQHHPDANGGDKAAEERLKDINQAYKTLMNSLNA